jgi:hypothetical protein
MIKNHMLEFKKSAYHSAALETVNSETMHFWTYVHGDIKYMYYFRVRKSSLNLFCFLYSLYKRKGNRRINVDRVLGILSGHN